MSRWLIIFGVVLIAVGLLWPVLQKLGLGRLPGDIVIERENFLFYFPIVTSLIVSVVLSLIVWLLKPGEPVCNIFYGACSWRPTSSCERRRACNFCMPPIRVINSFPSFPC